MQPNLVPNSIVYYYFKIDWPKTFKEKYLHEQVYFKYDQIKDELYFYLTRYLETIAPNFAEGTILIGSDHAGFGLKNYLSDYLTTKKVQFVDCGCYTDESCDYPDIAHLVARSISKKLFSKGILICKTGNGMQMTANRHESIRAALCCDENDVRYAKENLKANIIALGSRCCTDDIFCVEHVLMENMLDIFLGNTL